MLIQLIEARYLGDHRVWLKFSDETSGEVDLRGEIWGEVFEPLKDPAKFAQFHLDRTLVWPNGADFAPEFLHDLVRRGSAQAAEPKSPLYRPS